MVSLNFSPRLDHLGLYGATLGILLVFLIFVCISALNARENGKNEESKRVLQRRLSHSPSQFFLGDGKEQEDEKFWEKLCCKKTDDNSCCNFEFKNGAIRFVLRPFFLCGEFISVLYMLQIFWDDQDRTYNFKKGEESTSGNYIDSIAEPRQYFVLSVCFLIFYQFLSSVFTFALEFHQAEKACSHALYQLTGLRGIITMYREVHDNEDSQQMTDFATLQALFFSAPFLWAITLYAFEAFQGKSQGEWYAILYITMFLSAINMARAMNYRDKFGLMHDTLFANIILICFRVAEVYLRICVLSAFAAYFNRTITGGAMGFCLLVGSSLSLQREQFCRRKVSGKATAHRMRKFVGILFQTVQNYFFFDLGGNTFGFVMNVYKVVEMATMMSMLIAKNSLERDVFEKEHRDIDLRLFLGLRICPGVVAVLVFGSYLFLWGNYSIQQYRECISGDVPRLLTQATNDSKNSAMVILRTLIQRKDIEDLSDEQARIIFTQWRGVEKIMEKFKMSEIIRLRYPMEKVSERLLWKQIKKAAIEKMKLMVKGNEPKPSVELMTDNSKETDDRSNLENTNNSRKCAWCCCCCRSSKDPGPEAANVEMGTQPNRKGSTHVNKVLKQEQSNEKQEALNDKGKDKQEEEILKVFQFHKDIAREMRPGNAVCTETDFQDETYIKLEIDSQDPGKISDYYHTFVGEILRDNYTRNDKNPHRKNKGFEPDRKIWKDKNDKHYKLLKKLLSRKRKREDFCAHDIEAMLREILFKENILIFIWRIKPKENFNYGEIQSVNKFDEEREKDFKFFDLVADTGLIQGIDDDSVELIMASKEAIAERKLRNPEQRINTDKVYHILEKYKTKASANETDSSNAHEKDSASSNKIFKDTSPGFFVYTDTRGEGKRSCPAMTTLDELDADFFKNLQDAINKEVKAVYSQGEHTKFQDRKKIKFACGRGHGLTIVKKDSVLHIDEDADNEIKFVVESVAPDKEDYPSIAEKEGVQPNWVVELINDEPFSMVDWKNERDKVSGEYTLTFKFEDENNKKGCCQQLYCFKALNDCISRFFKGLDESNSAGLKVNDTVYVILPHRSRVENLKHMEPEKKRILEMLWKQAKSIAEEKKIHPRFYTLTEKYDDKQSAEGKEETSDDNQSAEGNEESVKDTKKPKDVKGTKDWWYMQFFGKTIISSKQESSLDDKTIVSSKKDDKTIEEILIMDQEFDGMGDIVHTRKQMTGWVHHETIKFISHPKYTKGEPRKFETTKISTYLENGWIQSAKDPLAAQLAQEPDSVRAFDDGYYFDSENWTLYVSTVEYENEQGSAAWWLDIEIDEEGNTERFLVPEAWLQLEQSQKSDEDLKKFELNWTREVSFTSKEKCGLQIDEVAGKIAFTFVNQKDFDDKVLSLRDYDFFPDPEPDEPDFKELDMDPINETIAAGIANQVTGDENQDSPKNLNSDEESEESENKQAKAEEDTALEKIDILTPLNGGFDDQKAEEVYEAVVPVGTPKLPEVGKDGEYEETDFSTHENLTNLKNNQSLSRDVDKEQLSTIMNELGILAEKKSDEQEELFRSLSKDDCKYLREIYTDATMLAQVDSSIWKDNITRFKKYYQKYEKYTDIGYVDDEGKPHCNVDKNWKILELNGTEVRFFDDQGHEKWDAERFAEIWKEIGEDESFEIKFQMDDLGFELDMYEWEVARSPADGNGPKEGWKLCSIELTTEDKTKEVRDVKKFEDQYDILAFLNKKNYDNANEEFFKTQEMTAYFIEPESKKTWDHVCTCFSYCIWSISCCMPMAWLSYRWYCCRGGYKVTADQIINEKSHDGRKFLVEDGDIFLASFAHPGWLSLSQGGQWGHCGLVWRYKEKMVKYLPARFKTQLDLWKKRGVVEEHTPLIFEMCNHTREEDTNKHKVHLSHLANWHMRKETEHYFGPMVGIRKYTGPRDLDFYQQFFFLMHRHHLKEYESVPFEFVCSGLCCYAEANKEEQLAELFCSELVAEFHNNLTMPNGERLTASYTHASEFQPSDYGERKSPCPFSFMCCCCFAYACSDGRQTSEYNIKNYLGDLYVVDISSIQELTQQSNMKLQGSRLMESFEVDDKTLLSLNPRLMSRRKQIQRDIFRRSSHMQATTADLLQMEIYEAIKMQRLKTAKLKNRGLGSVMVELTWWIFYIMTFPVGVWIRYNYQKKLQDEDDEDDLKEADFQETKKMEITERCRQLWVLATGAGYLVIWWGVCRWIYREPNFHLPELFYMSYFVGVMIIGLEGSLCNHRNSKKIYAAFYRNGFRLFGVKLRQDSAASAIPISEKLAPVKIPFITVLMGSLSLLVSVFLESIGYNAKDQSVSGKVDNFEPLIFFGSLFGFAAFLYKVGQYVIQSAIGEYPEILMQLAPRSRYKRHEIENEVVQFLKEKDRDGERRALLGLDDCETFSHGDLKRKINDKISEIEKRLKRKDWDFRGTCQSLRKFKGDKTTLQEKPEVFMLLRDRRERLHRAIHELEADLRRAKEHRQELEFSGLDHCQHFVPLRDLEVDGIQQICAIVKSVEIREILGDGVDTGRKQLEFMLYDHDAENVKFILYDDVLHLDTIYKDLQGVGDEVVLFRDATALEKDENDDPTKCVWNGSEIIYGENLFMLYHGVEREIIQELEALAIDAIAPPDFRRETSLQLNFSSSTSYNRKRTIGTPSVPDWLPSNPRSNSSNYSRTASGEAITPNRIPNLRKRPYS